MDIKDLVDAAIQALVNNDTRSIKEILRQDSHADYIFASVMDGRALLPARDLLLGVNTSRQENFRDGCFLCPNYDNTLGNILLHQAIYISDCELIRLLLEKGADVMSTDLHKRTALHIACVKASLEIIKFVIEKSPHILHVPDQCGCTPLDYACQYNCPDVAQFLLSQGSSVGANEDGRFPVYYAVCNDVAEYATPMASLLLDAGANMNVPSWQTPLMYAIKKAADVTLPSANSTTSQNSPYVDLCMLLIARGCDVNAAGMHGRTALHFAVMEQLENIVRKLLISGSDIDRCDKFGNTPLHYACRNGSQTLVDLLIISGANLGAVDWETTLKQWRNPELVYDRSTQLLNYVIHKSKQCLSLETLCCIRKILEI